MRWAESVVVALTLVVSHPSTLFAKSPKGGYIEQVSSPRRVEKTNEPYEGTVTSVTQQSITIQAAGQPAGKRFVASDLLASGGFKKNLTPGSMYRMADVRVGDSVLIRYNVISGVSVCTEIRIQRRPGGKVPPSPGQLPNDQIKYHEYTNAYWDEVERGIPMPLKFIPISERQHNAVCAIVSAPGGLFKASYRVGVHAPPQPIPGK
jgi:hypothetical protein